MAVKSAQLKTHTPSETRIVKTKNYITWKDFERRYLRREDTFKYEWHDGIIEKTPRTMNVNQFYIWRNLVEFLALLSEKQGRSIGMFPMKADIFLQSVLHKRPDICFFTDVQIERAADNEIVIPDFVIEVISPSDTMNRVNKKIGQYFDAGVKVLWHVFPELKEVHVFDNNGKRCLICKGDDICSAETVIEGFSMTVDAVFKRHS